MEIRDRRDELLVENCRLVGPGMRLAPIPMPPYL